MKLRLMRHQKKSNIYISITYIASSEYKEINSVIGRWKITHSEYWRII